MAEDNDDDNNANNNNSDQQKALFVDASLAGPAADWWALGCVLYQLLRGRVPFIAAVPRGGEANDVSDRDKLRAVVAQARKLGPLFPPANEDSALNACQQATRALLAADASLRWSRGPASSEEAAAFLAVPDRVPAAPVRGRVAANEVDMNVKQRKFSMLWSNITQRTFSDETGSKELEIVPETQEDMNIGWR